MQYLSNERVKELKKLKMKKYREERKLVLVEGVRIIKQLLTFRIPLKEIYCTVDDIEKYSEIITRITSERVFLAKKQHLRQMSATDNPQDFLALVETKRPQLKKQERLLFIDRVSDPGNIGTIFRTAMATLMDGIILSPDCCEIFNPKTIRASMGTVFVIPSKIADYRELSKLPNRMIITDIKEGISLFEIKPVEHPYLLVIGSEATGINQDLMKKAACKIHIPMGGDMESLNVSVAAGLCMYSFNRDIIE